jgi:diguanylate cyclase (GGDEF)-like protein
MSDKQVENLYSNKGTSITEQLAITRQLVMLQSASVRISETLDQQDVLQSVPEEFASIFSFSNCAFYLVNEDKKLLKKAALHNPHKLPLPSNKAKQQRMNGASARSRVIQTKKTVHISQANAESFPEEWGFMHKNKYESYVLIPISKQNQVIGILEVFSKQNIEFATHEFVIIKLFTDNCAIAIENADLYQRSKTEIENRKSAEEKLRHDALHDELTGLPNRSLFLDRLERLVLRNKRQSDANFAVIYIDLDNFKQINDTFGHIEGDKVLIEISKILIENTREVDTVSRFGGDEFLVLLDGYSESRNVQEFVDRILDALNQPISVVDTDIVITASIGIALPLSDSENAEDYIRNSDIAMYHAKSRGKGRYEFFSETKGLQAKKRLMLESELRNSIQHMRFLIHYQPIVELDSQKIVGLEALLRWQPMGGEVQLPETFIGHLETMGLLFDVGLWVLRESCKQLLAWGKKYIFDPPLTMSVNISNSQVVHPRFVHEVEMILEEFPIDPGLLILEITENIFIRDTELVSRIIKRIQALGVQIHLDDFGAGYSSLSYLDKLPIDAIKIDRAFIQQVVSPDTHRGVINSIILLAKDLGLSVIAEGIETETHVKYLENNGCKLGQGFFFNKGLPTQVLEKQFKQQQKRFS